MRYYPQGDPNFYWDISDGWNKCQRCPCQRWRIRKTKNWYFRTWRDLEGSKMEKIAEKDLVFKDWKCKNYRAAACLPTYYSLGERFVGLEQTGPAGQKCSPIPLGHSDAQDVLNNKKDANGKEVEKDDKKQSKAKSSKTAAGKGDVNQTEQRTSQSIDKYIERMLKILKNKPKTPPFRPGFITGPNLPYLDCRVGAGITPPQKCCLMDPCNPACCCSADL